MVQQSIWKTFVFSTGLLLILSTFLFGQQDDFEIRAKLRTA